MTDSSALGDRMKAYEQVNRQVLPRRTYSLIRVDGRAFHSFLRGSAKPFDFGFMDGMDRVAEALCKEVAGAVFAYSQSDEISVLLTDFGSVHTEPWFGGVVEKMASIAASVATASFAKCYPAEETATFDARVFTIPTAVEVANYFIWRQRDAVRNSVSMAAQAAFSHKSLHGLNGGQMQEKLWAEKGVNWNDYPVGAKRGRVCQRASGMQEVTFTHKRTGEEKTIDAMRSWWESDGAPHFTAEPGGFLADTIPVLPSLQAVSA